MSRMSGYNISIRLPSVNVPDVDKALEELKVQLTAAGYDKLIEEAKRQYAEYTAN